jgi:hypothetical protein
MRTKVVAPRELEPRAEHPHRCTAGHRWQHDGPAATTCGIPSYDPISGDLPFVGPEDCPVCCGRSDLLVRELHSHYCNLCDGDWKHEGHCLDSLAACCPWCFPKPDSEPMPGARSGPHFHVCSECGQNWRHETGCSAPLRAALAECPGCQRPTPLTECDAQPLETSATTPSTGARALGDRIRPLARSIGVAAVVLLSIPLVLKGYSMLGSPGAAGRAPVLEERIEAPNPAPTPSAAAPPAEPAPDLARPPAESSPAKHVPPSDVASLPPAPRPPLPRRETRRAPAGNRVATPQAQEPRPRVLRSGGPEVLSEPAPRPLAPNSGASDAPPATPPKPAPSVARSELVAETPPRAPEPLPTPSESGPPATPVGAARPSIPGAPPFSGLSGSSGLDTSLDGHPRRVNR